MKKIPTIFKRNPEKMAEITIEPHDDCGWVFDGEGVPTRKYDGSCCRVKDGKLWKRREVKSGKPIPDTFVQEDHDDVTGKTVGWMPVTDNNEDKWHIEAFGDGHWPDGTYELCGPKVQGNPEGYGRHVLVRHRDATQYYIKNRTFYGIRNYMFDMDIEGIVFYHPDGRMAKIKKRDYGLPRKPPKS